MAACKTTSTALRGAFRLDSLQALDLDGHAEPKRAAGDVDGGTTAQGDRRLIISIDKKQSALYLGVCHSGKGPTMPILSPKRQVTLPKELCDRLRVGPATRSSFWSITAESPFSRRREEPARRY